MIFATILLQAEKMRAQLQQRWFHSLDQALVRGDEET